MNRRGALIAGGGPAGSVAARSLALAGIDVVVVDARREGFRPGESLPPNARQVLADAGAWERFVAAGHAPCYGNVSAWGSDELAYNDFIRSPFGTGHHIDRTKFDSMLLELAAEAGAEVRHARVKRVQRRDDDWLIDVDGEPIAAEWLVDCGGRSSSVLRSVATRQYDDSLVAIFTRYEATIDDDDATTLVESAPDGWFHTARLPENERVVTLFTDAGTEWATIARSAAGFATLLETTKHVAQKVAGATPIGAPVVADARTARLTPFAGEGWVAAGDAAIALDPLSSNGIVAAMYSGMKAAEAICSGTLAAYESRLCEAYARYLSMRRELYAAERRWVGRAFWDERSR